MIEEAAPVVPHYENRRRIPEPALSDGIDQRGDPRRSESAAAVHVIGVEADRRDPGHALEIPRRTSLMNRFCGVDHVLVQSGPYRM